MALTVLLNGETRVFQELQPGAPLAALVLALGLKPDRIALERNGEIVRRAAWEHTLLSENDKLELVHFVGGGAC